MLRQMERSAVQLLAKRGKSRRAIARELGINRETVARILHEPVDRRPASRQRASLADPFETPIRQWLTEGLSIVRMLERVRERLGGVAHSISGRVDEGCTDALAIKCDVSHAHACRRLWKVQQGIRLKTPGCPQRSSGQTGVSTGLARWYSCGTVESADRDDVS